MRQRPVLVLSPHTDDAELGCGGTICRFVDEGRTVHVVAFSSAHDPDRLEAEFHAAMRILEVASYQLHNFPVRRFHEHRQEILDLLIEIRDRLQPELVLMPSMRDLHQDHQVLATEAVRAFKNITCWGYELPWNHRTFDTVVFTELKSAHLDVKWHAVRQYESQSERPYFSQKLIESLARIRGIQIGHEYAEAFDVVRMVA